MLECVPNVSEGRRADVIDALARACGPALLDVHSDVDHHRSVFTLAGPARDDAVDATRRLAGAIADRLELGDHEGVHPRFGALDVVPFVGLAPGAEGAAREEALSFAEWFAASYGVPVFLYGEVGSERPPLPEIRRNAFTRRAPDLGPDAPHPKLGAVAVGARPPLVAVNCRLDRDDLPLARDIATLVRETGGGLPGVRALGLRLASRGRTQVSMNLTRLEAAGLERACTAVRRLAYEGGADVEAVEVVGLVPAAELERCGPEFVAWSGIGAEVTIEARLARRA